MNIRELQQVPEKLPQWHTVLAISVVGTIVGLGIAWLLSQLFLHHWSDRLQRLNEIDTTNRDNMISEHSDVIVTASRVSLPESLNEVKSRHLRVARSITNHNLEE